MDEEKLEGLTPEDRAFILEMLWNENVFFRVLGEWVRLLFVLTNELSMLKERDRRNFGLLIELVKKISDGTFFGPLKIVSDVTPVLPPSTDENADIHVQRLVVSGLLNPIDSPQRANLIARFGNVPGMERIVRALEDAQNLLPATFPASRRARGPV